ncbi:MAG: hypothetical protein IPL40_04790 [Proteobacteria bacterium]|nr:hypothetical protein [Pseudomonadota bacterium]
MLRRAMPSSAAPAAPPRLRAYQWGLGMVSAATMLLQISWTRALSVALWYHFAFLVISTAMLGFGVSGVLLTLGRRWWAAVPLDRALWVLAVAQAAAALLGFLAANHIPFAPFALLADARQLVYGPLYVLALAAPFVCSGLIAALLLGRHPAQAGTIYLFDLVGAGVGALLLVAVMPAGVSTAIAVSAALACAAAAVFATGRARRGVSAGLALLLGLCCVAERALPLRISPTKRLGTQPIAAALGSRHRLYTGWNTFSRVDVIGLRESRMISIDAGTAFTRLPRVRGPLASLAPVEDAHALALRPQRTRSALIIGSGGGVEVLAALRNGVQRVVAVEVNPLINALVRGPMAGYIGELFADPRVELHTDEARSFIARQTERFDAIVAAHTISNAATAAGALSLAESYLLTVEAVTSLLDHLSAEGVLWITRPEPQLPRLVATVRAALGARGRAQPWRHVAVYASRTPDGSPSFFGGVYVGARPLPAEWLTEARQRLGAHRLRTLYLPGESAGPPIFRSLLRDDAAALAALFRKSRRALEPTTDDRPFFNQHGRWGALRWVDVAGAFRQQQRERMALEDQPVAEVVLLAVLAQSLLLALLLIVVPLALGRRRGALIERGSLPLLLYFSALGLGFMLAEVALIQRLTLFIGQPVHAFATVIGALLLSSGVGSGLSQRWAPRTTRLRPRLLGLLLSIALALLLVSGATNLLLRHALAWSLATRLITVAALLTPLGILLGAAFPLGLRHAGERRPGLIPWAWGLNAVTSVVGAVLAVIAATVVGFTGVLALAAAVYAGAAGAWLWESR